jgi:cellulose biosynthesis protein BcsQ
MTKSTTTVNIAAALAERGGRGCVVDTDTRQLDASRFAVPGCETVSSLQAIAGDFAVIDTPPQPEGAIPAMLLASVVVIPCTPELLSLEALARTFEAIEVARQQNLNLRAVVLFTRCGNSVRHQTFREVAGALSAWPVSPIWIPARDDAFERAVSSRVPVVSLLPKNTASVA